MNRHVFPAGLGGLTAALGHAPFNLWYIALPGFVLLFHAVLKAETNRARAFNAWLGGLLYFAIALHWIVEPFLVDAATHGWMAPFALVLMAGGLALFWGLAGYAAARLTSSPAAGAIAFAATLSVAELVRGYIFTGFPWAMPAYVWADTELIHIVAFTGSYGLTAITLLAVALTRIELPYRGGWIAGLGLLLSLHFAGGESGKLVTPNFQTLGRVGIVHPNVPQADKWNREKAPGHIERLLELTASHEQRMDPVDMIVWPEVAVVYPLDVAGSILARASSAAGDAELVSGINRRENGNWFNSMVVLGGDGVVTDTYDKTHLVPFGEYIPFKLGFLRALAATSSNGFSSGDDVRLIDTALGRALPLICYEGIFARHFFKPGERPDYALLITNDAWFGDYAGPAQHLDQARFRAAEQGLSIVRVANKGFSGVISPNGDAYSLLRPGGHGAFQDSRVHKVPPTLYAATGNWPLYVSLFLTLCALSLLKRRNIIAMRSASR